MPPVPSYVWPVNSGIIVAVVNGKIRVTFPVDVIDTPSLRNALNYSVAVPVGFSAVQIWEAKPVNTRSVDLGISGSMKVGVYTLNIASGTVREESDGIPNPAQSLTFNGVSQPYNAPLASALLKTKSLMGSGLSFPLRVGSDGEFVRVTGEDNVDECLLQLLQTEQGERPFTVRDGVLFGTRLRAILFENGVEATELAYQTVNDAITIWEPRVRLLEMGVEESDDGNGGSAILVGIKYIIIASGNVRNLIFPYILQR